MASPTDMRLSAASGDPPLSPPLAAAATPGLLTGGQGTLPLVPPPTGDPINTTSSTLSPEGPAVRGGLEGRERPQEGVEEGGMPVGGVSLEEGQRPEGTVLPEGGESPSLASRMGSPCPALPPAAAPLPTATARSTGPTEAVTTPWRSATAASRRGGGYVDQPSLRAQQPAAGPAPSAPGKGEVPPVPSRGTAGQPQRPQRPPPPLPSQQEQQQPKEPAAALAAGRGIPAPARPVGALGGRGATANGGGIAEARRVAEWSERRAAACNVAAAGAIECQAGNMGLRSSAASLGVGFAAPSGAGTMPAPAQGAATPPLRSPPAAAAATLTGSAAVPTVTVSTPLRRAGAASGKPRRPPAPSAATGVARLSRRHHLQESLEVWGPDDRGDRTGSLRGRSEDGSAAGSARRVRQPPGDWWVALPPAVPRTAAPAGSSSNHQPSSILNASQPAAASPTTGAAAPSRAVAPVSGSRRQSSRPLQQQPRRRRKRSQPASIAQAANATAAEPAPRGSSRPGHSKISQDQEQQQPSRSRSRSRSPSNASDAAPCRSPVAGGCE